MEDRMNSTNEHPWVDAGDGVRRRVLAESPEAMTVRVEFQAGAVGDAHSHPHVQTIYVAAGQFEFTVGGETKIATAGESLVIPSNAVHGCVCVETGTLIDSFAPRRDDFL